MKRRRNRLVEGGALEPLWGSRYTAVYSSLIEARARQEGDSTRRTNKTVPSYGRSRREYISSRTKLNAMSHWDTNGARESSIHHLIFLRVDGSSASGLREIGNDLAQVCNVQFVVHHPRSDTRRWEVCPRLLEAGLWAQLPCVLCFVLRTILRRGLTWLRRRIWQIIPNSTRETVSWRSLSSCPILALLPTSYFLKQMRSTPTMANTFFEIFKCGTPSQH